MSKNISLDDMLELIVQKVEIDRLKRYEDLVIFIANDYTELSYDKAKNEYLHIIQKCRALVREDGR